MSSPLNPENLLPDERVILRYLSQATGPLEYEYLTTALRVEGFNPPRLGAFAHLAKHDLIIYRRDAARFVGKYALTSDGEIVASSIDDLECDDGC